VPPTATTLGETDGYNAPQGVAGSGEIDDPCLCKEAVERLFRRKPSEKPQLSDTSPPPFSATHWLATATAANRSVGLSEGVSTTQIVARGAIACAHWNVSKSLAALGASKASTTPIARDTPAGFRVTK
jgi:hypothetical protein